MNCDEARVQLRDFGRRRLDPAAYGEVAAHVRRCSACAAAEHAERLLDGVLAERLPRYAAPEALKRRLAMIVGPEAGAAAEAEAPRAPIPARAPRPGGRARSLRVLAPALAASVVLAAGVTAWRGHVTRAAAGALTSEVVNDHLRVLASQHPLDVESGGAHQVKPWFEGRLDFAPTVPTADGTDLRLRGGAVGYVLDRKAAVVVYALRLHAVTLLVVRAEGLAWPAPAAGEAGPSVRETSARGFQVVWWRAADLGYALVSDVGAAELADLGARLARDTTHHGAR